MPLHLLVDHGAYHNLGDAAMLEAVVRRLDQLSGGAAMIYVRNCPMDLEIWRMPNVSRLHFEILDPGLLRVEAARSEASRRRRERSAPWWNRVNHLWLGRTFRAGHVYVRAGNDSAPLARWSRGFDGLLVAGGGGLNDLFPNQMWQRVCLLHAFAAARKPTVLTGQQFGPFSSRITRRALTRAISRAAFVGVREPGLSARLCAEADLPEERFKVMGDDALGLTPAPDAEVRAVLQRHGVSPGRFLAVNVRSGYYAPGYARHFRVFAEAARRVAEARGLDPLFVPIALGPLDSDVESARHLQEVLGPIALPVLDADARSAPIVKGVLGKAWAALGVSYHFCHFALEQGVPATLVYDDAYYGQKGSGLRRFWGDGRLAIPLERLYDPSAVDALTAGFEDVDLRRNLERRGVEAREAWARDFDRAVSTYLLRQPATSLSSA